MLLEVDVEPLAAGLPGVVGGDLDQACADAPTACTVCDDRVEEESVGGAVPGHVDEPDQADLVASTHPPKAVAFEDPTPVGGWLGIVTERFGMKRLDFDVVESAAPLVFDRHRAVMVGAGPARFRATMEKSPSRDQWQVPKHEESLR